MQSQFGLLGAGPAPERGHAWLWEHTGTGSAGRAGGAAGDAGVMLAAVTALSARAALLGLRTALGAARACATP